MIYGRESIFTLYLKGARVWRAGEGYKTSVWYSCKIASIKSSWYNGMVAIQQLSQVASSMINLKNEVDFDAPSQKQQTYIIDNNCDNINFKPCEWHKNGCFWLFFYTLSCNLFIICISSYFPLAAILILIHIYSILLFLFLLPSPLFHFVSSFFYSLFSLLSIFGMLNHKFNQQLAIESFFRWSFYIKVILDSLLTKLDWKSSEFYF